MLTFKHYLIKAFAVFAFTFASATMATAQENTQTTQPAPTTKRSKAFKDKRARLKTKFKPSFLKETSQAKRRSNPS